jgi:hypothetical protein
LDVSGGVGVGVGVGECQKHGKLDNKEHHILYTSLYISRMIKSSKVRWTGHVAYVTTTKIVLDNFGRKT